MVFLCDKPYVYVSDHKVICGITINDHNISILYKR